MSVESAECPSRLPSLMFFVTPCMSGGVEFEQSRINEKRSLGLIRKKDDEEN